MLACQLFLPKVLLYSSGTAASATIALVSSSNERRIELAEEIFGKVPPFCRSFT